MSQDPFLEREIEKYVFQVPSREFILNYLSKRKKPASSEELIKEFHVNGENQLNGLRRRLHAMRRDGQLIFTRRRRYALPKHLDLLRGVVIGHRNGFGFLRVDGIKEDYYLSSDQMKIAIHGDIVLAQSQDADRNRKGRREARIIQVLIPKNNQIVGRFFSDISSAFVIPDDSRFSFNIIIPPEDTQGARVGFMVVVELIQRTTRYTKAIGKIIEVLGDNIDTNMAINIALRTHNIPYIWPPEIEQQLSNLQEEIPEAVKNGRIDLRMLPLITIDSEDAHDFDDAVYCEKKSNGDWRLWVAIADVSYYVRLHTPLDQEANRRVTSIYFPSQVIPMLPEILSNGICSLNPHVDRLCMVCEMNVSINGQLSSYKFYEAVMNSCARLTYSKVWHILQGDRELCINYGFLIKPLTQLYEMYKILEQARIRRGGISFETEDIKFILNTEHKVERIELIKRNDAHKLIEECMILANTAAANFVEKNKEPALYRVHDRPTDDSIISLRTVLSEFGVFLGGGDRPEPKDYAKIMNLISNRSDCEILQTILLRSMKQAIYDSENRGHFGLALQSYTHFTSPIRRYSDLVLHRIIKYLLDRQNNNIYGFTTKTGGYHFDLKEMLILSQQCSFGERRADDAIRDVTDWLKCDLMQNYVGKIFSGVITNVTNFGFFVRIDELFIDGRVHISSLNNDYYRYDNIGQRLIGESSGKIYRIGDMVKIRVKMVNMNERKIDFSLISVFHQLYITDKIMCQCKQQNEIHDNYHQCNSYLLQYSNKELSNSFEYDNVFNFNNQT